MDVALMGEHLIVERWEADGGYWVRCPNCQEIGQVDKEQYEGDVSIICFNDDFHGTLPKNESRWANEHKRA